MSPLDNRFVGEPALLGAFSLRTVPIGPFPPLADHRRLSARALVTWVAGEAARSWFSVTGPAMARYARDHGADFVVLEGYTGQPYPLANKLRVRQVLTQYGYDRLIFVDADALITSACVDLFELVPYDRVGILDETHLYDEWMLARYRREALSVAASQGWDLKPSALPPPRNSGLYVISQCHAEVLEAPVHEIPLCSRNGATIEQTWMSLQLARHEVRVHDLRFPEHHWLWYADQQEHRSQGSMVVHYAGLSGASELRLARLRERAEFELLQHPRPNIIDGRELLPVNDYERQMMLTAKVKPALRINNLRKIGTHLKGWDVATKALTVLANEGGVVLDDFVESTFLWHGDESYARGIIPYRSHWVGFVHNPPGSPPWPSIAAESVAELDRNEMWHQSLKHCLGLFALTEHLASWVRGRWKVPCETVLYPTLIPEELFSPSRFQDEETHRLACVGFWLRRYSSFDALAAPGYRKQRIVPVHESDVAGMKRIADYERDERRCASAVSMGAERADVVARLEDTAYNDLLRSGVVFLDLIDASGVTTVVECIANGTPLLVNRIPPIVEYLGHDYPLYFTSLDEASRHLADTQRILRAHCHMLENPLRDSLRPQAFLDSVGVTETYQRAVDSANRPQVKRG